MQVWSEVLGLERIGVHNNFFEIGGHSLKAMQVVSKLANLGFELSINQVFAHQNGKVDRRALPQPDFASAAADNYTSSIYTGICAPSVFRENCGLAVMASGADT